MNRNYRYKIITNVGMLLWVTLGLFFSCGFPLDNRGAEAGQLKVGAGNPGGPYLLVLGEAQDAGYPQAGCAKACCRRAWVEPGLSRYATSLALIDPASGRKWLFEATPDFKWQLWRLNEASPESPGQMPTGIFLSHAHIGHYSGLIHLGREVIGSREVPVYAMPGMAEFLGTQAPWSQLVSLKNIALQPLIADSTLHLGDGIAVTPFLVPHRDEFSETVGFRIQGPGKSALFIPDIDKWEKWERDILKEIQKVDYALVDGTFFENGEIPGRDMSEIPHPFIRESLNLFGTLSPEDRAKIYFIHFNHTNPVLDPGSNASGVIRDGGFRVAGEGLVLPLH